MGREQSLTLSAEADMTLVGRQQTLQTSPKGGERTPAAEGQTRSNLVSLLPGEARP